MNNKLLENNNDIIMYTTDDGQVEIEVRLEDENEDFLAFRGWKIMLEFLKEYDVLIWGRKMPLWKKV